MLVPSPACLQYALAYNSELIKTTYQFINVVNGVSRSHKTANIFFHLTQLHSLLTGMYNMRCHYKAIHLKVIAK